MKEIETSQAAFCRERGAAFNAAPCDCKLGFAASTKGRVPINGLHHPPTSDTTGWYIWFGEELSDTPDFFLPMHVAHVYAQYPQLIRLLGLPPGSRFLLAGDYLDVWFDANLMDV